MRSFSDGRCPTEEEFVPVEGASADEGDPPPLHAASRAAAALTPEARKTSLESLIRIAPSFLYCSFFSRECAGRTDSMSR
jgi:hypothetical protein